MGMSLSWWHSKGHSPARSAKLLKGLAWAVVIEAWLFLCGRGRCYERSNDREHARTGCRARGENGCRRLRGESLGNRLQRVWVDGVFDTQIHAHVVTQAAVCNTRRQSGVV